MWPGGEGSIKILCLLTPWDRQGKAELIASGKKKFLYIDGHVYYHHYTQNNSTYWNCRRKDRCRARAITIGSGKELIVRKGPKDSLHSHAPNREEVQALTVMSGIKRHAADHPQEPPARIMRGLHGVHASILAELPDRHNIRKIISRERTKEIPSNPQKIEDLGKIPEKYRTTSEQKLFLLYDSFDDPDYDLTCGRIIIFSTHEKLKLLFRCLIWYVDGTFKSAPKRRMALSRSLLSHSSQFHPAFLQSYGISMIRYCKSCLELTTHRKAGTTVST